MSWKKVAILSVTGTETNCTWTTDSLRCPPFTPAIGADKMPPPTRKEPTGWWYEGQRLLDLIRDHNIVIFQHVPPVGWINDLRDSKASRIDDVYFWIDVESTVAAGYWSKYQQPLETVQRAFTLRAPGGERNRFGNDLIDPYEGYGIMSDPNDWKRRESKHSWFMDMGNQAYIDQFVTAVANLLYKYQGTKVFTDNCYSWQYPGTATNVKQAWMLDLGGAFVAGMQSYLSFLRKFGLGVWGNCAAVENAYPQLDGKMGELDLVGVSDPAVFANMVAASIGRAETDRRGLRQMYAVHCENRGQGPVWAQSAARWKALDRALQYDYQDNMAVVTARSSRYLLCPEVCQ